MFDIDSHTLKHMHIVKNCDRHCMEKSSGQHVRVCVRERERGKEIANEKERWLHSELVYEIGDGRYDNVLQKPILSVRVAATTAAHFISFIFHPRDFHSSFPFSHFGRKTSFCSFSWLVWSSIFELGCQLSLFLNLSLSLSLSWQSLVQN